MMKHRHLVMGSVLILSLGLGGCTWDSSLYETYARNDSVTRCPPGDLLTDAEGKKYIDLSTAECYKSKIKFKLEVGNTYYLLKNGTDGEDAIWQCVDEEQNCTGNAADCENCPAWIEDYRMCMAFQDFEDLFEKDNDTMPSIDFIADDRPTKNLLPHYPEASKYRICPSDYGKCYYHKDDSASERGQFGCVSECPLSMIDPNTGKCQFSCSQNTCRVGNKCENQDQACGRDCVDCTTKSDDPKAKRHKCNKHGACTAQECQPGYHLKAVGDDQFACEENKDYLCGTVNSQETFDCSEARHDPNASSYKCNKHGACTVQECQRGYHLKAVGDDQYKCERNTDALCGPVNAEAVDCSIFDANDEIYRCHANGYCTVEKCQSGYHLIKTEKDDQYKCELNTDALCGPVDAEAADCAIFDANDEIYRCHDNGHCTVTKCQSGHHLKKTEKDDQYACEANTDVLCGPVDSEAVDCSEATHDANASIYRCNKHGACTVKVCNIGCHLKATGDDEYACEANADDLCGAVDSVETFDCSNVTHDTNASSYRCNDYGVCTVKDCQAKHHLKKSEEADDQYTCEANSSTACGSVDSVAYNCSDVDRSTGDCNDEGLCACQTYNQASLRDCSCYIDTGNQQSYNEVPCSCLPKRLDNGEPYCMKQVWCNNVACHEKYGWLTGGCKGIYSGYNSCHNTACQKGYHQKKTKLYKESWVAECEINTDKACGLAAMTYEIQFDNYPVNCEEQNAKCDNDYGLCYNGETEQYWCQSKGQYNSDFDWRGLSDCYR